MPEGLDQTFLSRRDLRTLVLEHFIDAKPSLRMSEDPVFRNHTRDEVHAMLYACETSGLIHKIRGDSSGSIYQTTDDGLKMLGRKG